MKRILKKNQVVLTLLAVMIAVAGYLNYTADSQTLDAGAASGKEDLDKQAQNVSGELLDISEEDILAENRALSAALQETLEGSAELNGQNTSTQINQEEERENQSDTQTGGQAGVEDSDANKDPMEDDVRDTGSDVSGNDTPGTAVFTSGSTVLDYVAGVQLSREQTRARNKETLMDIIDNANLDEAQKQDAINAMLELTAIAEKETAAESLLAAKGFDNSIVYINEDSVDVVICRTALTDAERAQIEDIVKRKAEVSADKIVLTLLEMQSE